MENLKNNIKLIIIIIVIFSPLAILIFATGQKNNQNLPKEGNLYALTTKVVMIDYPTDVVWCEDYNGNIWEFYGCEDWAIDDIASLLMNDKGTELIYDDEIVGTRYNGSFEGWR